MNWLIISTLLMSSNPNYTMTVFSYQRGKHQPGHSHTWAVFTGPGERICISWGPADKFRLFSGSVMGRNRTEAETLTEARNQGATVGIYGPYPIDAETFYVARSQAGILATGKVKYRALDRNSRPYAINCIHAVSDIGGPLDTGILYGHKASAKVATHILNSIQRVKGVK